MALGAPACVDGPDVPTDEGAAPRPVVVEIDQMDGTAPLQLEQSLGGRTVSLRNIYAEADLELDVRFDETDLPRADAIRLADLHALMTAHSSVDAGDALKVYVIVVTEEFARPDTLGVMFDFGELDVNDIPREAFAVFQTAHDGLGTPLAPEMLLTTAHELAHVFNIHHPDWEGDAFASRSTIEGYSLTDTVKWSLSGQSKAHLRQHARRLVEPGAGSLPFGMVTQAHLSGHQDDPPEAFDLVDDSAVGRIARDSGGTPEAAVRSRLARRATRSAGREAESLRLSISAPKPEYDVGEPVVLTVKLTNEGAEPREVLNLLEPEYRFLSLSIGDADGENARRFRPALLYEARARPTVVLEPGESTFAEAKIFFGAGGWTFQEAGEYRIGATYPADASIEGDWLESNALTVRVTEPETEHGQRALRMLRVAPEEKTLGTQQGLYLLFGGGDHLLKGAETMREISRSAPSAPHVASARLALASAALSPTIRSGVRGPGAIPEPRVDEAQRLLRTLPAETLPPLSLLRAREELARAVEQEGNQNAADQIRGQAADQLRTNEPFRGVQPQDVPKILRRRPAEESSP